MPALPRPTAAEELDLLARVAAVVSGPDDLEAALGPELRALSEQGRFERATLTLLDPTRASVRIEAAHGLTPHEIRRGEYALGDGVTGGVAASGAAAVVPRIAEEPRWLDRTGVLQGGDRSFVCVPVVAEGRVVGTLSGYRPVSHGSELEADVRLLSVVAALIAPACRSTVERRGRTDGVEAGVLRPANLIGRSKVMIAVYDLIGQVAPSGTTVLLRGESGTGKELVAQAIHQNSPRARGPFVSVNCAALPETLIESELFGHERGSFTGAIRDRKGRFELAEAGAIFLDEIGDLAPATQVKLLRVLQEREFERVGGQKKVRADVRVIAATSRDLEAMIEAGTFRSDLYYRLNVFPIHIPPLRERRADILLLADHFVETFNRAHGRQVRRIATPAIDLLMSYHWPGNVRELENCIERAVLLARGDAIQGHHLPPSLQTALGTGESQDGLDAQIANFERDLIADALKVSRGNMARAARDLKITERIMGLRVKQYGIDPDRYKVRE